MSSAAKSTIPALGYMGTYAFANVLDKVEDHVLSVADAVSAG